jgi:hypothetical protein
MDSLSHALDMHAWLPIRLRPSGDHWDVDWCHFGTQALHDPFFADSVTAALLRPFNQALRRHTDMDGLLDWQARSPGIAPTAFVFHTSRCGSTLIAQVLANLDTHIVLSEPPTIDTLLRAHYEHPAVIDQQPAWLRALLSAYGQRRGGKERALVVKLDAWSIFELPLLRRCFPAIPCIFLYRDPVEITVSHLQSPGRHMVPGLIGTSPLALPQEESLSLSRPEFIARTVGRLLSAGLDACVEHGAWAVNYTELPEAIGGRLAPLFALDDTAASLAGIGTPLHSKRQGERFQPDSASKQRAADESVRTQVAQWACEPYVALEAVRQAQRTQQAQTA